MEDIAAGIISLGANDYLARVGSTVRRIRVLGEREIKVDDRTYSFSLARTQLGSFSLLLDDSAFEIFLLDSTGNGDDKSLQMMVKGISYNVTIEDHRSLLRKKVSRDFTLTSGLQEIRAPMPGKVVRVEVKPGDTVSKGTGLLVLEAMKMENELKSTSEGSVENVLVEAGKAVEKGEVLLSIKSS